MTQETAITFAVGGAALVYLVSFGAAAMHAARGNVTGRVAALAIGVIALLAVVAMTLFATIADALRCDENCNENLIPSARTPGWRNTIHAWQWNAQWIVSLAALVFAVAAVVLVAMRRERAAIAAAAAGALSALAWAIILSS
jgi:hypothetical protein